MTKDVLKKIWNIVSTILVAIVVLCAVFLMGSRLFGYRVFNVISGSMAPAYNIGDLIYVKEVDVNTIQIGDVISFVLNEDLVVATHRVLEIDTESQHFVTQGDVNDTTETVHFKNVIGVAQFKIPLLGYVSDYIQNPPGMYITIGAGVILIILVFLPDMIRKKEPESSPVEEEKQAQEEASQ